VAAPPIPDGAKRQEAARVAGLASFAAPTLEAVDQRRLQLWFLTLALLVSSAAALALITLVPDGVVVPWLHAFHLQVALLLLVALFCAYAIEKELWLRRLTALLVEERVLTAALTDRLREATVLLAAAKAANAALELEEVLETILRSAVDLLNGRDGSIMLLRGAEELRTVCATGDGPVRGASVPFGKGIAGRVAVAREPMLISGALDAGQRGLEYVDAGPLPTSAMSVPLIHRGSLLGVLNLVARPDHPYTEYDLRALSLFGEQAAGAIANAQLYEEQRLLASQNLYQALHDPLTRLPNRTLFLDRLRQSLARRRREGLISAVLFFDLDDFKRINDSMGHAAGDSVLVSLAGRLLARLRASDTLARFGGDEFAVLVEDIAETSDAVAAAGRLFATLAEPFGLGEHSVWLRASLGVAGAAPGTTAEELMRNADIAMHAAKADGKGRIIVFDPVMHDEARQRLELESELQDAIHNGQVVPAFQPVVALADGSVVGLEVLARWRHPRRGLLPGRMFVPQAEQARLIAPIDRAMLRAACLGLAELSAKGLVPPTAWVSVNISGTRLDEPGLIEDVVAALQEAGVKPERLMLELTESAVIASEANAAARIAALKALGVRIALDDFGAGFSSLSHVRNFTIDAVKIDRTFTQALNEEGSAPALVQAIVRLGTALAVDVIAEGIERPAQRQALLRLGCSLGQGYLLAHPIPLVDVGLLLARGRVGVPA
jgi:diguanylate cyclase (GGDEF)-like protein